MPSVGLSSVPRLAGVDDAVRHIAAGRCTPPHNPDNLCGWRSRRNEEGLRGEGTEKKKAARREKGK